MAEGAELHVSQGDRRSGRRVRQAPRHQVLERFSEGGERPRRRASCSPPSDASCRGQPVDRATCGCWRLGEAVEALRPQRWPCEAGLVARVRASSARQCPDATVRVTKIPLVQRIGKQGALRDPRISLRGRRRSPAAGQTPAGCATFATSTRLSEYTPALPSVLWRSEVIELTVLPELLCCQCPTSVSYTHLTLPTIYSV